MVSIVPRHDITAGVVAIPDQASTLAAVQQCELALGFPLKVLGRSDAAIVPRRVGNWWMEPLNLFSDLPPRPRQRLDAVLAMGITPRAVVLFHEIAPTDPTLPTDGSFTEQVARYAAVAGDAMTRAANILGPLAARAVVAGAIKTGRAVRAVGAALKRGPDPCLVIVTGDGYWVELDRWYS